MSASEKYHKSAGTYKDPNILTEEQIQAELDKNNDRIKELRGDINTSNREIERLQGRNQWLNEQTPGQTRLFNDGGA